ncbi:MAG: hypothetical protein AMXMBFR23_22190 [Chloroflexota bacterium]
MTVMLALVTLILAGCAPDGAGCAALALTPEQAERLAEARAVLDFDPVTPCGTGSAMGIGAVSVDRPDGTPRLTFTVEADGPLFLLSQSRSIRRFTQIPDGASHLDWTVRGTAVRGFDSPAGLGPAVVYLRWERGGVWYEFQANPSARFPAPALHSLARLNIERTIEAERDAAGSH